MAYLLPPGQLAEIIHELRWDESMPEEYHGLRWNQLMETVVDALIRLDEFDGLPSQLSPSEVVRRFWLSVAEKRDPWRCSVCGLPEAKHPPHTHPPDQLSTTKAQLTAAEDALDSVRDVLVGYYGLVSADNTATKVVARIMAIVGLPMPKQMI